MLGIIIKIVVCYLISSPWVSLKYSIRAWKGMVSVIVCEASRSNLGMLVEPLY